MKFNIIKFKKPFNIKKLLSLVAVGLGIVQIFISCSLSTYGKEIKALSKRRDDLRRENQRLENKSANLSSLSYIRRRAETELGMKQPDVEIFASRRLVQKISQED